MRRYVLTEHAKSFTATQRDGDALAAWVALDGRLRARVMRDLNRSVFAYRETERERMCRDACRHIFGDILLPTSSLLAGLRETVQPFRHA